MLRILAGPRPYPRLPWEMFVTLGGALVGAGGMFTLLFPWWASDPGVGVGELAVYLGGGIVLIMVGIRRRRTRTRSPPASLG